MKTTGILTRVDRFIMTNVLSFVSPPTRVFSRFSFLLYLRFLVIFILLPDCFVPFPLAHSKRHHDTLTRMVDLSRYKCQHCKALLSTCLLGRYNLSRWRGTEWKHFHLAIEDRAVSLFLRLQVNGTRRDPSLTYYRRGALEGDLFISTVTGGQQNKILDGETNTKITFI